MGRSALSDLFEQWRDTHLRVSSLTIKCRLPVFMVGLRRSRLNCDVSTISEPHASYKPTNKWFYLNERLSRSSFGIGRRPILSYDVRSVAHGLDCFREGVPDFQLMMTLRSLARRGAPYGCRPNRFDRRR